MQAPEQHHAAQTGAAIALSAAVAKLWNVIDPTDLKRTIPVFVDGATALVRHYGAAARSLSAAHYERQRRKAGVTAPFRVPLTVLPDAQKVSDVVSFNTEALWSSSDGRATSTETLTKVEGDVASALEQLVLDVGRNEIIEAIQADQAARGWYRVTKSDPCFFCAMLAARGRVYRSEESASFRAHQRVDGKGGDCRCTAEPSFANAHESSAQVREWQRLYAESTKNVRGMKAKQRAFRRAYEAAQRGA